MSKHNRDNRIENTRSESQLNAEAAITADVAPRFGKVSFSSPERRKVTEKWGRTSCIVLNAYVPLLGTGLRIETAIWAELKKAADGMTVVPEASLPRSIKVDPSEIDGDAVRDAFMAHVENAALDYPGYETAYDSAANALLEHATGQRHNISTSTGTAAPAIRPKLARALLVKSNGERVPAVVVSGTQQPAAQPTA